MKKRISQEKTSCYYMYHIDNKNNYEECSLPEEREVDFWYVLPLAGDAANLLI